MNGEPTRGEWLNNPCNIRISSANWLGKITPSSDKDFEQFNLVENGIRAATKTLCNYHRLDGLSTIQEVINRWAPPAENNTSSYVTDVCQRLSADPDQAIDFSSPDQLEGIIHAIIWHENGRVSFTDDQIMNGVQKAIWG